VTRDEFGKLPPAMQLSVLARVVFEREALASINVGKKPFAPKYDARMFRSGGFQWASETSIDGLRFWHAKAKESSARGGEYAEKDAKRAKELERWIAWREWFPTETWQGERNNHAVTGAPPADRPAIHQFEQSGRPRQQGDTQAPQTPPNDDDDVGFA
jgi:hypothetical protein